ncbi:MAG: hypothetical protein MK052_03945 [Alphaproteobacteria bacterium]|nr:hypothetical protein [Alphaproteobacteria bacterium]
MTVMIKRIPSCTKYLFRELLPILLLAMILYAFYVVISESGNLSHFNTALLISLLAIAPLTLLALLFSKALISHDSIWRYFLPAILFLIMSTIYSIYDHSPSHFNTLKSEGLLVIRENYLTSYGVYYFFKQAMECAFFVLAACALVYALQSKMKVNKENG